MANGCPGCELNRTQFSHINNADQDVDVTQRARTASPEHGRSSPNNIFNPFYTGRPRTPVSNGIKSNGIDRQEIIRRIKSGGSRPTSPELERPVSSGRIRKRTSPTRDVVADLTEQRPRSRDVFLENQAAGILIERPRSALHRGDFREHGQTESAFGQSGAATKDDYDPILSTSPVAPWHPAFPSGAFRQLRGEAQSHQEREGASMLRPARARATSHASLASSFTYKAPTSPLVQSSRPDTPEPSHRQRSRSPDKSRRHTFSPQSFQRLQSALDYPASARHSVDRQPPLLRAERTYPYQAHQPRRSLHAAGYGIPQTPGVGPRRPSLSDSPLHHAPLVGSYEESILRGRMSTTPSKPLDFVAQIGVLGKGDCAANLKCPPHVSIAFPAVFYSYGAGNKTLAANDQPSPYVGLVDLENGLPSSEEVNSRRRPRVHASLVPEGSRAGSRVREDASASDGQMRRRRRHKQKRRSGSPKAPPGGSYRIPQRGQLQIVIKNPNKTAVKLFLVPYDLTDMEPGQKTFIRQRSYSAGPIIDMPLSHRKNLGTDRPEAALNGSDDPNDRPMLRYLIHLNFCCPSKGRFYLFKAIRVVFANRVPDGKEKLRNEIQLPEPRYSPYRPGRDSLPGASTGGLSRDAIRRRSLMEDTPSPTAKSPWQPPSSILAQSLPATDYNPRYDLPLQPFPHPFTILPTLESRPASRQMSDKMEIDSDRSQDTQSFRSALSSPRSKDGESTSFKPFPRLEEPFNFERDRSRERQPGQRSESLLSKRLMDLAFQSQAFDSEQAQGRTHHAGE